MTTVTSTGGFSVAVTLAGSGQPTGVTCAFDTNPVTPPPNGTATSVDHQGLVGLTEDRSINLFVGFARTDKGTLIYRYPGSDISIVRDRNSSGIAVGEAILPGVGQVGFVFIPR
jgi:hypothetical protein